MVAAAAHAVLIIMMLMMMLVVMVAAVLVLLMVMVVMMAAFALLMVMLVMMAALALLMVMIVMVAAFAVVVVMMVMLLLIPVGGVGGLGLLDELGHQVPLAVHDGHDLLAVQGGPVGGDDGGGGVLFLQQGHGLGHLGLVGVAGAAEDQAGSMAHLVVVELAEVLHIQLDLVHVGHGDKAVQHHGQGLGHALHGAGHIGQLAHAGGLDEDAVGMVGLHHLLESFPEVAHQAAADAAGVQLVHLDARFPHETAVNADLTEFVFDEHQLFAAEGFLDELLDQGSLAGTQKAGENIDLGLCHIQSTSVFCLDKCVVAAKKARQSGPLSANTIITNPSRGKGHNFPAGAG